MQPAVFGNVARIEQIADQNRNTGDPNAVVSGIGLVKTVLLKVADSINIGHADRSLFVCVVGDGIIIDCHIIEGKGFFVLDLDGRAFRIGGHGLHLSQSRVSIEVFGFGVKLIVAADRVACGSVFVSCVVISGGANAEQVPAVAEQAVVRPVRCRCANADHGDPVHDEHDSCEDRQAQPAVGDDLIDLVGAGKLTGVLFLVAALDDLRDVHIALVGDDGLCIVVQLRLSGLDVRLDVLHDVCGDAQLFEYLIVTLEDLDGIPALLRSGLVMQNSLFDVRDGVLDRAGEGVLRLGVGACSGLDGCFRGFHNACALQSGDLQNRAAQLTGQLLDVDLVSVLLDDVHHVDRHDDRDAKLGQLRGEVEVTLKVRAVDDVQNRVWALGDQIVTGDDLFERVGGQRINTGKVHDHDVVMLFQLAFLLFDRDARPVADELVRTGQRVEQRGFTAVRVARKGNFDLFFHLPAPFDQILYAISIISVSAFRRLSS